MTSEEIKNVKDACGRDVSDWAELKGASAWSSVIAVHPEYACHCDLWEPVGDEVRVRGTGWMGDQDKYEVVLAQIPYVEIEFHPTIDWDRLVTVKDVDPFNQLRSINGFEDVSALCYTFCNRSPKAMFEAKFKEEDWHCGGKRIIIYASNFGQAWHDLNTFMNNSN